MFRSLNWAPSSRQRLRATSARCPLLAAAAAGAARALPLVRLLPLPLSRGRLLLLLEPRVDAGLVPLARWFQIEARDDLICHRGRGLRRNDSGQVLLEAAADTRVLTGDLANDHPITEFLARRNIGVFLPDARSLKHSTDRSSKDQKYGNGKRRNFCRKE